MKFDVVENGKFNLVLKNWKATKLFLDYFFQKTREQTGRSTISKILFERDVK
jgi:hypothetical protein